MEKFRNIRSSFRAVTKDRKARIALSVFVAAGSLTATPQAEARDSCVYAPISNTGLQPLVLNEPQIIPSPKDLTVKIPSLPSPVEKVKKLTRDEIKVAELKAQRDYWLGLAKRSGKFNKKLLSDLHDNLPFYLAAGEKYNIDWRVLWRIQEAETGGSDPNSIAFAPSRVNSPVQGSWQINVSWGQSYASDSFKGLEYLKVFPERHNGDAVGAAEAAHMLHTNMVQYKDLGYDRALFNAMSLYSGPAQAAIRIAKIAKINAIFKDQINKEKVKLGRPSLRRVL